MTGAHNLHSDAESSVWASDLRMPGVPAAIFTRHDQYRKEATPGRDREKKEGQKGRPKRVIIVCVVLKQGEENFFFFYFAFPFRLWEAHARRLCDWEMDGSPLVVGGWWDEVNGSVWSFFPFPFTIRPKKNRGRPVGDFPFWIFRARMV